MIDHFCITDLSDLYECRGDAQCGPCRLRAELARLRSALAWYAAPETWAKSGPLAPSEAAVDRGARAQAALEAKP